MRVAVLCGGRSSEHDVSLRSGEAVAGGLEQAGHEALLVTIARDGGWSFRGAPVELTPAAGLFDADAVFPALHGPFGEDGSVQGVLEWLDVPYVGSDVLASAVCMDKLTLKRLFAHAGLPQVEFVAAGEAGWRERCEAMGLPLWVKPSRLGSSVGISRVESLGEELDAALDLALRHDPRVIVEASAHGREVECSLLGNERPEVSLPGEVVAHGDWYDYETKYSDGGMELIVPAAADEEQTARLRELAVEAFQLGGCAGLARCDFFVEPDGAILVNEINTMPGFTETSVYAKLWEASGLAYPDLCDRLLGLAIERHAKARSHEFEPRLSPPTICPMDPSEDRGARDSLTRDALERRLSRGGIELDPHAHYLASIGVAGDAAWKLVRGWTRIGRSTTADIRLDDPSVSRRHALIVIDADTPPRILDDRSLNGVFVNDASVEWAPLQHGDRIAIGIFALIYIAPASVAFTGEAPTGPSVDVNPLSLGAVPESWERVIGPLRSASEIETERSGDGGGVATAARTSLLLSALNDKGQEAYPAFQFDGEGRPFAAVEPCLREFLASGLDPYTTAAWFVTSQRSLDGMTPAKWMREDRTDAVLVEAASRSAALFRR